MRNPPPPSPASSTPTPALALAHHRGRGSAREPYYLTYTLRPPFLAPGCIRAVIHFRMQHGRSAGSEAAMRRRMSNRTAMLLAAIAGALPILAAGRDAEPE